MVRVARPRGSNDDAKRTMIREWRHFRGLSQDALAERVRVDLPGFSKSSLSRLENGKQSYSQPVLEALARSLDCQPSDLIIRDPNSAAWSIFEKILLLNKETQEQILAIIETFPKGS